MNDLEHELRRQPLARPSTALDARVAASLRASSVRYARPVPLWACAAACLVCLGAGWVLRAPAPAAAQPARVLRETPTARLELICRADAGEGRPLSPFVGRRFAE